MQEVEAKVLFVSLCCFYNRTILALTMCAAPNCVSSFLPLNLPIIIEPTSAVNVCEDDNIFVTKFTVAPFLVLDSQLPAVL